MSTDQPAATSGVNSEGRKVFLPLGTSPNTPATHHDHHLPPLLPPDTNTPSPEENNPSILNPLAHALGLSPSYAFHDLYTFDANDADLLSLIPRPALALLFVYPETAEAQEWHRAEVAAEESYEGTGDDPVMWFRQVVVNCEFAPLFSPFSISYHLPFHTSH